MIRYTLISRAGDGLPLVATMESQVDEAQIAGHKKLCKNIIRALSPDAIPPAGAHRLSGDGASIVADEYTFHYLVDSGIVFLVLTDKSYTRLLAFSYLTELMRAFFEDLRSSSRTSQPIHAVQRPYSFIRFEPTIQATKKRYINTRHLQSREDLGEMSQRVGEYPILKIADVLGNESLTSRYGFPALPPTLTSAINMAANVDTASPNALSKTQSRLLAGSSLCLFVIDIFYLMLRWTSWFGTSTNMSGLVGKAPMEPGVVERLIVLACGITSPILLLVAFRFQRVTTSFPTPIAHRPANLITTHALITLLQLMWAATSRRSSGASQSSKGAAVTAVLGYLAGWSMPVPVTILKVVYVLLITIAVAAATVNRWIGRYRDRKRGHRD